MTTQQVADRLVALLKDVKNLQAVEELYAGNVESVEALAHPGMPKDMSGIEAVRGKNKWFFDNHEVHSVDISSPLVTDAHFVVKMKMDCTFKPENKRHSMGELGVYEVKNGKIVREQFFYGMP